MPNWQKRSIGIVRLLGAKPLFEPMMIRFTDAFMRH